MRSGLWILLLVIVVGIGVGSLLKGRLEPPEKADDITMLREIASVEDPRTRIERLENFTVDYPESKYRPDAFYMIAGTMLSDLADTAGMIVFANRTLEEEEDPETRALMYYRLYRATSETRPDEARSYAAALKQSGVGVGWVYNYVAFDYAEKGEALELAEELAHQAIEYAGSADDSASYLDTRGWVYFKMGDYRKAIMDLEEAARVAPEPSDEILMHLANAQLRTGDAEKAFETFRSVLVLGEYREAREHVEAIMDETGFSPMRRMAFEEQLWEDRIAGAETVAPFTLPTLDGGDYDYRADASTVSIINFFGPT